MIASQNEFFYIFFFIFLDFYQSFSSDMDTNSYKHKCSHCQKLFLLDINLKKHEASCRRSKSPPKHADEIEMRSSSTQHRPRFDEFVNEDELSAFGCVSIKCEVCKMVFLHADALEKHKKVFLLIFYTVFWLISDLSK